jgi:hypothetical protein
MKKKMKLDSKETGWDGRGPFPTTQRPNNNWAYAGGMVPENPYEFGSAPAERSLGRFPHHPYGIAGLGAILEDGISGMDRHVDYIVPTGTNNKFENGGTV